MGRDRPGRRERTERERLVKGGEAGEEVMCARCRAPRAAGSRASVRNAVPLLVTVTSARVRSTVVHRRVYYARAACRVFIRVTRAPGARFPKRTEATLSLARRRFFRHFGPRALARVLERLAAENENGGEREEVEGLRHPAVSRRGSLSWPRETNGIGRSRARVSRERCILAAAAFGCDNKIDRGRSRRKEPRTPANRRGAGLNLILSLSSLGAPVTHPCPPLFIPPWAVAAPSASNLYPDAENNVAPERVSPLRYPARSPPLLVTI